MSRYRGYAIALTLGLAVLLFVSLQTTAPANGNRGIEVSPHTVEVGKKITVKGKGWKPGQRLLLVIGAPNSDGEVFATVKPNGKGKFKKKQKILAAGKWVVVACRADDCSGKKKDSFTAVG